MRVSRAFLIFALVVEGLVVGSSRADSPAQGKTSVTNFPRVTRVLYLQGMSPHDASVLLRTQIPVSRLVELSNRGIIIVAGAAGMVDQCESILRQRSGLARSADPHKPLDSAAWEQKPDTTRSFQIRDNAMRDASLLLRIYDVKDVKVIATENSISVRTTPPIADACAALLRELGLLVE